MLLFNQRLTIINWLYLKLITHKSCNRPTCRHDASSMMMMKALQGEWFYEWDILVGRPGKPLTENHLLTFHTDQPSSLYHFDFFVLFHIFSRHRSLLQKITSHTNQPLHILIWIYLSQMIQTNICIKNYKDIFKYLSHSALWVQHLVLLKPQHRLPKITKTCRQNRLLLGHHLSKV